jgi:integrase
MAGTKTQVTPGVWRLRVVDGYDTRTRKAHQASRTFRGGAKEADKALALFVTEVEDRTGQVDGLTTLDAYLDRWLEYLTPRREPTTVRGYRDKLRRVRHDLGHVRMAKLSARQLDAAYTAWLADGLSPNTVHHIHAVLSSALRQAVRWEVVSRAVTASTSPPALRVPHKDEIPVQVIKDLIDATQDSQPVLASAIAVAATTGMRRGEICGLRWSDIVLTPAIDGQPVSGTLTVRRSVKHGLEHRAVVVGDTKTHAVRRISIDPFCARVLLLHRRHVEGWAASAGTEIVDDAYVFTLDPSGATAWRPDSLGQAFGRVVKRTGHTITFHSLRHFAATTLIGAGIDARTVAGRLGHADASTTLKVYSAFIKDRDRQAAELLGAALS